MYVSLQEWPCRARLLLWTLLVTSGKYLKKAYRNRVIIISMFSWFTFLVFITTCLGGFWIWGSACMFPFNSSCWSVLSVCLILSQPLLLASATSWCSKHRVLQRNIAFNMLGCETMGKLGLVQLRNSLVYSCQITAELHWLYSALQMLKWTSYPTIT